MDCAEPALGLEWVTEYINPRDSRQHRMYTCRLVFLVSCGGLCHLILG